MDGVSNVTIAMNVAHDTRYVVVICSFCLDPVFTQLSRLYLIISISVGTATTWDMKPLIICYWETLDQQQTAKLHGENSWMETMSEF